MAYSNLTPHLDAKTLLGFILRNLNLFAGGIVLAMVRCLVIAPLPWMFMWIIDHDIPSGNVRGVLLLSGGFVLLLGLHFVFAVRGVNVIARNMVALMLRMRSDIFNKLNFVSFGYLDKQKGGRLLSKYAFDTQKVEMAMMQIMNQFVPNILYSICITGLLVWMNWRLTVVLLLMIPIFAVMRRLFHRRIKFRNEQSRLCQEKLTGTASEVITALRLVRSFGQEDHVTQHLDGFSADYAKSRFELTMISSIFGTFSYMTTQFLSLLTVAGGAILVIRSDMTLGTLMAFMAGLPIIMMPIHLFVGIAEQYFAGQESYRSIRELLDSEYVEDWYGTKILPELAGKIEFDRVTFGYEVDRPAVRDISLTIHPGEHVALVGHSGAGKSTMTYLALGLYKTGQGDVRIDGVPQGELDMRWLRSQTAVVLQESLILSGSIADNIRFARPDATDAEVHDAAVQANAAEFIEALPDGYESLVGERGVMLSGGQRQRLSIARAILRNPKILILDEATSSLDYASERLVQDALQKLARSRTVITIAHRLSTIRGADRIVMMRDGRLVEQGTYQELISRPGPFSELLHSQTGNLITEAV